MPFSMGRPFSQWHHVGKLLPREGNICVVVGISRDDYRKRNPPLVVDIARYSEKRWIFQREEFGFIVKYWCEIINV